MANVIYEEELTLSNIRSFKEGDWINLRNGNMVLEENMKNIINNGDLRKEWSREVIQKKYDEVEFRCLTTLNTIGNNKGFMVNCIAHAPMFGSEQSMNFWFKEINDIEKVKTYINEKLIHLAHGEIVNSINMCIAYGIKTF